ncbi:MAG: hypothetical protein ACRDNG_12435 [Gaiellaceae bacterium]
MLSTTAVGSNIDPILAIARGCRAASGKEPPPNDRRFLVQRFESGRDDEALVALLTSEPWPKRVKTTLSRKEVLASIAAGEYGSGRNLTYFVVADGDDAGLVRLEDAAGDGVDPALDVRIRERWRGQGLGVSAVRFITDEFFLRHPDRWRIEGQLGATTSRCAARSSPQDG